MDKLRNYFYYWLGIVFMALNKIRHMARGYRTPRTFTTRQGDLCINYDFKIVDGWVDSLNELTGGRSSFAGKNVLELGPGDELGAGLILLALGARKYNAIDINPLVKQVPIGFYEPLLASIRKRVPNADPELLRKQLKLFYEGGNGQINYICDKGFSFSGLKSEKIDIVLSNATFQLLDDVENTIKEISLLVNSGGCIISGIDLQTHTRFLRQKDPLNIYRYAEPAYKHLSFRESPNRVRPYEYKGLLEKYGWEGIVFVPRRSLAQDQLRAAKPYLYGKFKECGDMDILSGTLFARKK